MLTATEEPSLIQNPASTRSTPHCSAASHCIASRCRPEPGITSVTEIDAKKIGGSAVDVAVLRDKDSHLNEYPTLRHAGVIQ
jgi:hypothetical protein